MSIKSNQNYYDSDFWAIVARLSLVFMCLSVLYTSFSPPKLIPHILYSYHLEHFAIFYLFALSISAAFVRRDLYHIGLAIWLAALLIEAIRWLQPEHKAFAVVDWFADAAGVVAALVPVGIGRLRGDVQHRP